MNFTDTLWIVLYWINAVAIILVTLSFLPQLLFYLFFFLPRKHWKDAKKNHFFVLVIPAHNEESVIAHSVTSLLNDLHYAKELYKVVVVAHNCKDHTAEEARKAGAIVYELNDPDPAHGKPSYPLRYGYQMAMKDFPEAEAFTHFDADNIPHPDFLIQMNKSIDAGARIVRAYEAATNLRQNLWTEECALFYAKDSRVQNNFRQALHQTAMLPGPGLTCTREVLERVNGYDAMSGCDDAEFTYRRLFDGYKCYFNTDAIVYEDQPSSYADTHNRLIRLGHSLNRLFFTDGWRMIVMFFRTGNPMYLDMLIQVGFNPISVMCFTWFPLYYATWAILMLMQLSGVPVFSLAYFDYLRGVSEACHGIYFGANYFYLSAFFHQVKVDATVLSGTAQLSALGYNGLLSLLDMAWQVIAEMSAFCIFQSWIALLLDHRKLGLSWKLEGMGKGIWLSPVISFIYGYCNCLGAIRKPKWIVAKRNPKETHILNPLPPKKQSRVHYVELSEREIAKYNGLWWKKSSKSLSSPK